ncbi:MAG: SoxR reducing system RseC family protein [Rhodocyclaceae bacterium]|nr:SoxR reducing system RseC family protein [Rhodocyclaceae bacterium]
MNRCDGIVERIEGDFAWVRAQGAGHACGSCARRDGCGSQGLVEAGWASGAGQLLKLPNPIHARPGDAVVIRAAEGVVWRAVWRAYLVPLLLGLLGALLARALGAGEEGVFLALTGGLAAGFVLLRRLDSLRRAPILSIEFKHAS